MGSRDQHQHSSDKGFKVGHIAVVVPAKERSQAETESHSGEDGQAHFACSNPLISPDLVLQALHKCLLGECSPGSNSFPPEPPFHCLQPLSIAIRGPNFQCEPLGQQLPYPNYSSNRKLFRDGKYFLNKSLGGRQIFIGCLTLLNFLGKYM